MKKYIFSALIMVSLHSLGQVYRFRSFESTLTKPNEQPADFKWEPQNILIVQDLSKNTIKFYSKTKESVLAIISGSPDTIRPTETYLSSRMKYTAIDEYGEK